MTFVRQDFVITHQVTLEGRLSKHAEGVYLGKVGTIEQIKIKKSVGALMN